MRSPRLLCLLALSALLSGCGSSPKGTDPNPGVPPNPSAVPLILDGNWEISAPIAPSTTFPAPLPSPVANFTGALHSSEGKVTGTFRALATPTGSQCVDIFTNLPVTGALDSSGNLNLSIALPGGTATVTAALPTNLRSKTAAAWQIVGGPCAMPTTAVHIEQFAPLTGAYTGTFSRLDLATRSPMPGTSAAVTAAFNQSPAPNADGQFPLTGNRRRHRLLHRRHHRRHRCRKRSGVAQLQPTFPASHPADLQRRHRPYRHHPHRCLRSPPRLR